MSVCNANNPVSYEYILMEKASGVNVSSIYSIMSKDDKHILATQLALLVTTLHQYLESHIGGLSLAWSQNGTLGIVRVPLIDLKFWMYPYISSFWGSSQTLGTFVEKDSNRTERILCVVETLVTTSRNEVIRKGI